ncbi:glycosyl transferase [Phaffia rhodozyma]|uniref:Class E vacuolar protein-sorting machinery protein HSE1 n=1 Tax=Phaffia rhodozyma TaxID=264483 RepID=A0A0F7SVH4_PHARH|nr:glycosyl transferase [Phaffia rhodozyma]
MFRQQNPFEEQVTKATDETLTSEDWALNIELCDKVSDEGETGARNAMLAVQKRLAHRNPNVQIFALELANTLSENCGQNIHREIASKSFTEGLERVVTDRTTNERVRQKVLQLIRKWNDAFQNDSDLGIMNELFERLRRNSEYSSVLTGSSINEAPPDEEIERARAAAEEAEMQRVLELSKQDKGGRSVGASYTNQSRLSGSSSSTGAASAAVGSAATSSSYVQGSTQPTAQTHNNQHTAAPRRPVTPPLDQASRVRALYDYTPANPTELPFNQGDIIKVIGRTYAEWWRGTLRGRVGIFPVNYVEPLPIPTWEEMQREREEEDEVFGSVAKFDELLEKLKGVDVNRGDRVEESREIEELYGYCVGLQGKISSLIQKYQSQKADLEQISNIFTQASYQYQSMKNPQVPLPQAYPPPHLVQHPSYGHSSVDQVPQQVPTASSPAYAQHPSAQAQPQAQSQAHLQGQAHVHPQQQQQQLQQPPMDPQWAAYYAHQQAVAQGHAPASIPGQTGLLPPAQHLPSQDGRQSPYDPQRREQSPSQQIQPSQSIHPAAQPSHFSQQNNQMNPGGTRPPPQYLTSHPPAQASSPSNNPWSG